ncbi:ATP-binding cassette domain-containing protein [Billgrantia gudaonensis]|uniref:ATP-binding cassette domain-containing protein n=1 Tax=Billgrantia gudaonensis TaxID=376427 RepID=A0A3S0R554_9GAMM|nr:ATP-binding cassette domain-containing protein [Halomonas gudaonensis]
MPVRGARWSVAHLSSGEKQRLALLRAVSRSPSALLLDEPTANLDDATARRVEAWLRERIRVRGWPAVWVAHDMAQIARVADRHAYPRWSAGDRDGGAHDVIDLGW